MAALTNKIDFALVFSVKNANPNGDPLGGNRPRTTTEGFGEVSDVCLKRKIRNRLQQDGESIFVQSDGSSTDGFKSLSERFAAMVKNLPATSKNNRDEVYKNACQKWIDVRAFGQVFAFKKRGDIDEVSLGVRGPVTIQSAFSVEPVLIESTQITKTVNSEPTEKGGKSSDTMGMKHRVSEGLYVAFGSINPQLAELTGFSQEDAEAMKNAIKTIFFNDESSARPSGSINLEKMVWWTHNNKNGQYSSKTVHNSLVVDGNGISVKPLADLKVEEF